MSDFKSQQTGNPAQSDLQAGIDKHTIEEVRMKLAQSVSKTGTWDWNIKDNTFYWSEEFLDLFGLPKDTIAGFEAWKKVLHPDDIETASKYIQLSIDQKTSLLNDYRIILPSQEVRWIRATGETFYQDGEAYRMIGLCIDVTDLKQTESELIIAKEQAEKSEVKFRKAILNNPDAITINRLEDGVYVTANKGFYQTFEYTEDEVIGKSSLELNIWTDYEQRTEYKNTLLTNGFIENFEVKFNTKTGKPIECLLSSSIIEMGEARHTLNITKDISKLKNIERELLLAKEKAEESDRLKSAFLKNMAHEIRTPMNAICGFSELLNAPNITPERIKKFTSLINSNSQQLLSIITDILTISFLETRQESIRTEVVSIDQVFKELALIFSGEANAKKLQLNFLHSRNENKSEIYTDKSKVIQILTNLISNALKFTIQGQIDVSYAVKGSIIEFTVKDTGIGIDPLMHSQIFERFVQANTEIASLYGGTGLGLAISLEICKLLNGKIWVESEIGKGSSFHFTLPYVPTNTSSSSSEFIEPGIQSNPRQNQKSILVAEDQETNFFFINEVLSDMNISVLHASDGLEAIEIVKSDALIDMVIMDIRMPNLDGYQATRIIKEIRPGLPIVALTAHALKSEIESAKQYEFTDYLTKPVSVLKLTETINKYLH